MTERYGFPLCRISRALDNPGLGANVTQRPFIPDDQPIRCVFRSAPRKLPSGAMLGRVLPGGALVAAALFLPELSVGAGYTVRGPAPADPAKPLSARDIDRAPRGSGAATGPLAGVRYGALLDASAAPSSAASPSRNAAFDPSATSRADILTSPSRRDALPDAGKAGFAPRSISAIARPVDAGRTPPTDVEQLEKAAAFATSVLNAVTALPGLAINAAPAIRTLASSPETDQLDRAALYSVSVVEKFVEQAEPGPDTARSAALGATAAPALAAAPPAAIAPPVTDLQFTSSLDTRVDGRTMGQVDFQQSPAGLKIRLGSVAEVLADRLPADELARIRNSSSGNAWLSLAELQAQGIPISFDPAYDEFNIGHEENGPGAAPSSPR